MDNLLAGKVGTKDGHGGRAEEHRKEMEQIAFYDPITQGLNKDGFTLRFIV